MDRLERSERAHGEYPPSADGRCSLEEWRLLGRPDDLAVTVGTDEDVAEDLEALLRASEITISFPAFTDGRGFSLARRLRQRGFAGALIASGDLLPDQWGYLRRSGFTALESPELGERAELCLNPADAYQADANNPLPLFRRRFV